MPWAKDGVILERINLVRTLQAQGFVAAQMVGPVNELMRRRGCPEVTIDAVYDDFVRVKALQAEERAQAGDTEAAARQAHVESWQEVKRQAWRAFHSASTSSLNRGSYLNTIAATEEKLAKLDQTLTTRVDVEATLHNGDRDLDAEIDRLLTQRLARPRLVVESPTPLEADRSA